uniref:Putative 16.8 kDa salivary protein n=1 Tax=Culex quinquefasciatus TaxID=7176 RepID=Q6TRY2_CULQU|nr:putative 16.8 kDa salivary protein [Culex quinquefasciatus]
MKAVLALFLALAPFVLADVPTGCVTLWHRRFGNYLASSTQYDPKHRHVTDRESPERWKIFRSDYNYRIMHVDHNEYLFASDWMTYSGNNNYVYTWIPRTNEESDKWQIERVDGNYYSIRNVKHGSCLFVGSIRWIYAKKATMCTNELFHWNIERC